ncbi:unnamed protein product [Cuscuta epithymum]|uniref:Uncharacterized protein n=1 Tax=Cuscuta epithymum TaxID=186058 RepID=A0AAV0DHV5_9ASTE|nr:unnamed protein product [Cuscuta epithymum]
MGRGVSAGGGQSSLGYLFGGDAAPTNNRTTPAAAAVQKSTPPAEKVVSTTPPSAAVDNSKVPAGIHSSNANNYVRADGQNCGNFITDRPSTKVHAAPGGGSSLGYLFGGPEKKN